MSTPEDKRSYRVASAEKSETVQQIARQMMANPKAPVGSTMQIVAEASLNHKGVPAERILDSDGDEMWREPEVKHDKLVLQAWTRIGAAGETYRGADWIADPIQVGTYTRNGKRVPGGVLSWLLDSDGYQPM